ncbi:MAG: stage V sporulation protein AD [Clostridia bacterium]|nr:stage V sporulation protein AD [Clostridia bacterium]
MKKEIITFSRIPKIVSYYSVVGNKEHSGPLGACFDEWCEDDKFGKDSWEKAESEMQRRALAGVIRKANLEDKDLDVILAGDLLNQCVGSTYGLADFNVPYLGLYGACSTCAEGILLSSCLYGGGIVDVCGAVTSSHYCSSERQFRFPLEYGGQRTPTAQWTTTGSGAFIIGSEGKTSVKEALVGRIVNKGVSDINNMGAAMAPAVIDTLTRYFNESQHSPKDFDLIVTGDLGYEGSEIIKDLLLGNGIDIRKNHVDCGLMVFNRDTQDVHAGGSGCGCSAVVMAGSIVPNLEAGILKNVLFIGTGALMSPMTLSQGESIPAVAHLVHLSSDLGG